MTDTFEQRNSPPRRRRFTVDVQSSLVHEALLVMWSVLGGNEKVGTHDLGKRWFDTMRKRIPSDIIEAMEAFGGDSGHTWLNFIGWVAAAPEPSDAEATLTWMETSDYEPFKRATMEEWCWDVDPDTVRSALEGDAAAIGVCVEHADAGKRDAWERWLNCPVEEVPRRVTAVLRFVLDEALEENAKSWFEAQAHSASVVQDLARVLEPGDLIERVTNGIDYEIPLGIVRLVLFPSVSIRPWTMWIELGDTVYLSYPISDDHMDADPDAPPQWLVRYHKALGDARRLRMLRRLAEGPARLTDLAAEIGLAKSTVFHHLGVLRAAGLVRVHVSGKPEAGSAAYTLRTDVFAAATEMIDAYLTKEDSHHDRNT